MSRRHQNELLGQLSSMDLWLFSPAKHTAWSRAPSLGHTLTIRLIIGLTARNLEESEWPAWWFQVFFAHLVWGVVGPGMCKAMGAFETLQCGGKDSVHKKGHFLGMQTRGWVILSKLCAWFPGLVFWTEFLFHPGFLCSCCGPSCSNRTFLCSLYQVRGWKQKEVDRKQPRLAEVVLGTLEGGSLSCWEWWLWKAHDRPTCRTSPWVVGTTRPWRAAHTGDRQEYWSSVHALLPLWASSDGPFHLLPPETWLEVASSPTSLWVSFSHCKILALFLLH